jgi:MarR family transcriptional repressor of emrRAB
VPHTSAHLRNVLGALALGLTDDERDAVGVAIPGGGPSLAAALVTVANIAPAAGLPVLATALGLSHSGTVRLVDRLQDHGLAERAADATDGRGVLVRLTPAGTRAVRRVRRARAASVDRWLTPLDDDERTTLTALVDRMLDARAEGRAHAHRTCRLCDPIACGHPDTCPVTQGADRAERTP